MNAPTELDFLKWFYLNADFGPADSDVQDRMKRHFEEEVGPLPVGYQLEEDDE